MSKEGTPELTKSWVFVDSEKKNLEDDKDIKNTSGVQEVVENLDSDTDSISVISESGCSYRTDEEEFPPLATPSEKEDSDDNTKTETKEEPEIIEKETEAIENEPEIIENEPEIIQTESQLVDPSPSEPIDEENKGIDKLLYFATSAVCAIIIIGLSVAVQQYLQGVSDVNTYNTDQDFIYVKQENVHNENPSKKYIPQRKTQYRPEQLENKVGKLEKDNKIHDKIIGDDDPKMERNVKANYKLNKNKNMKCNKDNHDAKNHKRCAENDEQIPDDQGNLPHGETYNKKIKELRLKEDYLREKEKFLIEKEHDLMKKEIKLNKEKENYEKQNKHDKKPYLKKEKEYKKDSSEEYKNKYKPLKDIKNNKKFKHKDDDKKDYSTQKKNISGQWYINLHEARDNMRQKKRANFKKNKAHWYFQWMVDRARLRVK